MKNKLMILVLSVAFIALSSVNSLVVYILDYPVETWGYDDCIMYFYEEGAAVSYVGETVNCSLEGGNLELDLSDSEFSVHGFTEYSLDSFGVFTSGRDFIRVRLNSPGHEEAVVIINRITPRG